MDRRQIPKKDVQEFKPLKKLMPRSYDVIILLKDQKIQPLLNLCGLESSYWILSGQIDETHLNL